MKPARKSTRWVALTGATVLLIGLAVGGWLFFSRKTHALTDKDTIVLADFTNTTGDAVFDGTLRQGLSVQLEQSPFLKLASEQRIAQALRLMGQPADTKLTPEIAREICQRIGSTAVLDGSIANLGSLRPRAQSSELSHGRFAHSGTGSGSTQGRRVESLRRCKHEFAQEARRIP